MLGVFVLYSESLQAAQTFPIVVLAVLNFLSGFQVTPADMTWYKFAYWADVMAWVFRGLAQNEFLAPRYGTPLGTSGTTLGVAYLHAFGLDTDEAFRWAALGVPLACVAVVLAAGVAVFGAVRRDRTVGAHREAADPVRRAAVAATAVSAGGAALPASDGGGARSAVDAAADSAAEHDAGVAAAAEAAAALASCGALPFTPVALAFRDVRYSVELRAGGGSRALLRGVTGCARPGRLVALMGASGERRAAQWWAAGHGVWGAGEWRVRGRPRATAARAAARHRGSRGSEGVRRMVASACVAFGLRGHLPHLFTVPRFDGRRRQDDAPGRAGRSEDDGAHRGRRVAERLPQGCALLWRRIGDGSPVTARSVAQCRATPAIATLAVVPS